LHVSVAEFLGEHVDDLVIVFPHPGSGNAASPCWVDHP
jgi:hypothetical protein